MDFDLNADQAARLDALAALVPPVVAASSSGLPGEHDESLAGALAADEQLTGSQVPLLDRVLLVEEAARLGAGIHASACLLIAPLADVTLGSGPIAVTTEGSTDPVRYGGIATAVACVGPSGLRWGSVEPSERHRTDSGLGSNYGVIETPNLRGVNWSGPIDPETLYRLGVAAEIAGAARAALDHTAAYLTERRAFGRPLSAFQALRHRMSELAVDAAGAAALVHRAAWLADADSIASAVAYAAATAGAAPAELHQICGARGFTNEFGLSRWTMLLEALRIELGAGYATAADYADARWPATAGTAR